MAGKLNVTCQKETAHDRVSRASVKIQNRGKKTPNWQSVPLTSQNSVKRYFHKRNPQNVEKKFAKF